MLNVFRAASMRKNYIFSANPNTVLVLLFNTKHTSSTKKFLTQLKAYLLKRYVPITFFLKAAFASKESIHKQLKVTIFKIEKAI